MDEVGTGVQTDSPPVDTGVTSAGTENTGSQAPAQQGQQVPAEKPAPFHTHPRWQQLQAETRSMRSELQQLRAWRQQQAAQQGQDPLDPDTVAAHKALEQLLATHPKLKSVLGVGDQVQQLQQQLQQLRQTQGRGMAQSGRSEIATMAKAANLSVSDRALDRYEDLVAAVVLRSPDLQERFRQGDVSGVLKDAWEEVAGFTSELTRGDAQRLAAAKAETKNLPPRPSGGAPGAPSPPAFSVKPGEDGRGATSRLHKMARELGASLTG